MPHKGRAKIQKKEKLQFDINISTFKTLRKGTILTKTSPLLARKTYGKRFCEPRTDLQPTDLPHKNIFSYFIGL